MADSRAGHVQVALATQAVADTLTATKGRGSVDVSVYTVTWLFNPADAEVPVFLKSTMGHVTPDQVRTLAESIAGQTAALLNAVSPPTASNSSPS